MCGMSEDQNTENSSEKLDFRETFYVWNASDELASEENSVVMF
jgi:hypothetical protein